MDLFSGSEFKSEEEFKKVLENHIYQPFQLAKIVAPLYVYLISDLAEGITGKVLNGSGGFIAEYTIPQKQPTNS